MIKTPPPKGDASLAGELPFTVRSGASSLRVFVVALVVVIGGVVVVADVVVVGGGVVWWWRC